MITTSKHAPRAAVPARSVPRTRRPLRIWITAVVAYLIALIFLLPYLEMLIMAVRPDFCITHYPGAMLVTDRRNTEFAIM